MDGEQKKKDPAGDGDPGGVKSTEKSEKSSTPVKVKEEPSASGTSSTSSTPSKSSDVKSEPKSSGGGSAAAGGASSSGGSEDMSEMDKAALSKALQDYMALAQTANALQNAQQVQVSFVSKVKFS